MLAGYIDGSNIHDTADMVCVAGCAAKVAEWGLWEEKWTALLKRIGLERWHHTNFMATNRLLDPQTSQMSEGLWLDARGKLCGAFEAIKPLCFGATVSRADYNELSTKYAVLPKDPYYFLLDRCLHRLIQGLAEKPVDEGMLVYSDKDKNKEMVNNLAKWHQEFLKSKGNRFFLRPDRHVVFSYGSNLDFLPLQAADVIAHEVMNHARRNPQYTFIPSNIKSGSFVMDRLKNSMPFLVFCFSKEILEIEVREKTYLTGKEPGFHYVPRSGEPFRA